MSITQPHQAFARITDRTAEYRGPGADETDELHAASSDEIRTVVLRRTAWEAQRLGAPVEVLTTGTHGEHRTIVSPDGRVTPTTTTTTADDAGADTTSEGPHPVPPPSGAVPGPLDATSLTSAPPDPRTSARSSFIGTAPPAASSTGPLTRFGIRMKPTAAQVQEAADVRATSQHWGGCRAVAIVNGKGGVGKTMTAAMLAAVFARNGGGSVLAWDNNDTRGTLGWRTESSNHDATIEDALTAAPALLDPEAGIAEIARYVHHQTGDRYDVMRSNPELLATSQRISQDQFDQLMRIAARYYRLVFFDSGNDESAPRWLRMIDHCHQLVVPTLPTPDSAESAALLLEALADRDEHCAQLARNAVVIVTQAERGSRGELANVTEAFAPLVRAVRAVPFDPALKSGPLRFESLLPVTRRAWTSAGAAVAAGFE